MRELGAQRGACSGGRRRRCSRACRPTTRRWAATVAIEGRVARPIAGGPSLLKRCLTNLVDNAVRYGGRATIAGRGRTGSPDAARAGRRARHPGGELEQVFEPFFRLEGSRSRETGGTGLGLGIARNIARAHGGDLVLRNRPEGGLEAVLTLPRRPSE